MLNLIVSHIVDVFVIERGDAYCLSYARSSRWRDWGHDQQSGLWPRSNIIQVL